MVRRVKAYLKNMKVITDEEKLHAMSLECEPPVGGLSGGSSALASASASATLAANSASIQLPAASVRESTI